jgi:carboxylate-amine ligase
VPDPFRDFADYAEHVDFLVRTRSIVEHTQLWWSVRPHHAFGTVELRICDAQSSAEESTALAGLLVACAAQAALDHDEGVPDIDAPQRLVVENVWRAIRFGLDGRTIDLERGEEFPSAAVPDRLLAWTAPARGLLGIEPALPAQNGTQRQREALEGGASIAEVFAREVETTRSTYAGQEVTT